MLDDGEADEGELETTLLDRIAETDVSELLGV
jgi:hypothetical protein